MESMLCHFKPVELTQEEIDESLLYVCYDRVIYHFLKRYHGINTFCWLFADRFWGFTYSEGNEPICPIQNGLAHIVESIQELVAVPPSELRAILSYKFASGYKASAMVRFERPDGTSYYTSTLLEGMFDHTVYYTKTNETSIISRLPLSYEDFLDRLSKDTEGQVNIQFLKITDDLLDRLQGGGTALYRRIMNIYDRVHFEERVLSTSGMEELLNDLVLRKQEILKTPMSKREQLRMHKHVANKIEPMLLGWSSILKDPECGEVLGQQFGQEFQKVMDRISVRLQAMLKWTGLVCSRPQLSFMNSYIHELSGCIEDFKWFQEMALKANDELLIRG